MLGIFKGENLKEYNTAYVLTREGDEYPFKYNKLSRTDITETQILKNIEGAQSRFFIMTTDPYTFSINLKIKIEGKFYHIISMYTEDFENANGIFRSSNATKKYLELKV